MSLHTLSDYNAFGRAPSLYLDADKSLFSTDGQQQIFVGHVVAIAPNVLISADKITLDKRINRIKATGHALLMSNDQIFTGTVITYDLFNEDLFVEQSRMITNEKGQAQQVISDILGFTPEEVEYEKYRVERLKQINKEQQQIIQDAQALGDGELTDDLVQKLALLIEQERLTQKQQNPSLAGRSKETRSVFLRRRQFWEEGRKTAESFVGKPAVTEYMKVESSSLTRTQGNDIRADEVMYTPCKCEDDEDAPWAIRASKVSAQMGGYLDFYDTYLEIAGVPILYLPAMKIPIKGERQSGFLAPNFFASTDVGIVVKQPLFIDISEYQDITILPELITQRGTRMGVEFRTKESESSKWLINAEGIKDKIWDAENANSNRLSDDLSYGLEVARERGADQPVNPDYSGVTAFREAVKNPSYWAGQEQYADCLTETNPDAVQECYEEIEARVAGPGNSWRGEVDWAGVEYIAPRFSIQSYGNIQSDHRYIDELGFAEDFEEAVDEEEVESFGSARLSLNFDGEPFTLNISSVIGDNLLEARSWGGQQLPFKLDVTSPLINFVSGSFGALYGRAALEYRNILTNKSSSLFEPSAANYELGNGVWNRVYADLIAPIFPGRLASSHLFARFERRDVKADGLSDLNGYIGSYRAGLEVSLPMEGEAELYKSAEKAANDNFYAGTFMEHVFSVGSRLSMRPLVVRDGGYGEDVVVGVDDAGNQIVNRSKYTYFASDQAVELVDSFSEPEETMFRHSKITLFTRHAFGVFDKRWVKKNTIDVDANDTGSSRKLAKELLLRAMDRSVKSIEDISQDDQYVLEKTSRVVPATLYANINYDFFKEKERDDLVKEYNSAIEYNKVASTTGDPLIPVPVLPEPWSNLILGGNLNWNGFSFKLYTEYNFYNDTALETNVGLGFPKFARTSISLLYNKENEANLDAFGRLVPLATETIGGSINSSVIPSLNIVLSYYTKDGDGIEDNLISHTEGFNFQPSSECWGISFLREKDYEEDESQATYTLQLNVIIDGQVTSLPNMAGVLTRHFGS